MSEHITTPVGRFVEGNLYVGNPNDASGRPKIFKSGKHIGKPRYDFYFSVALPKGVETHWNQTSWGVIIDRVAKVSFPQGQWQRPDFSWKIIDGDSTILNLGNPPRRPCDKEGFAGNWILKFSLPSPFPESAPFQIYNYDANNKLQIAEKNYINLGDYIQVYVQVDGNKSDTKPGMYLNQNMVAFSGYGPRIIVKTDPESVGFGQSPLPPGASLTPLAAFVPPVAAAQGIASPPYPQILNLQSPPAPIAKVMLPAAMGMTYEQYKAAGWTDEQLIQGGLMTS